MPPLLLLLHRPRARPVLPPRADLGALPAPVLLQRPQPPGPQARPRRHRLSDDRQRLRRDRRLEACPSPGETIHVPTLHRKLDQLARTYCPVIARFPSGVHWSLMQVEYATDMVFHQQDVLRPLYEALSRTAIHAVKCEQVATFLGRRLTESYEGEIGNDFSTRMEGTRIKHHMGPASIKMYDKFALGLAGGDHLQRRHLLQAPPQGGTSRRVVGDEAGPDEEVDLQPARPDGAARRREPALPGYSSGRSTTRRRGSSDWRRSRRRSTTRAGAIAASTCSTATTWTCSRRSAGVNSRSAGSATATSGNGCRRDRQRNWGG